MRAHLLPPLAASLPALVFVVLLACTLAGAQVPQAADPALILLPSAVHLGIPGQWEWDEVKDLPVHGTRLDHTFQAAANSTQQTLFITQKDVKQRWQVQVNGRRIGSLTTHEPALESVFQIPAGTLKDGENALSIVPPAQGLDDIIVGPISLAQAPVAQVLGTARIEVVVTDRDHPGVSLPCRLTLTKKDGTLQPLMAAPAGDVAAREGVVYIRNGQAVISVPAGDYVLYASRGLEWSLDQEGIAELKVGETRKVALQLTREVPTPGWIAADSHIHTLTHSGHGDARIEERVITIAGEGIELAVATDHNHHADFTLAATAADLTKHFVPIVGNEVTTQHGHFNAFPITPGAPVVDHKADDWSALIPAIRATPGVQVITLNHPRDLHSGFVPLGPLQFNPTTGRHRDAESLASVDALEVVTSGAMQSDIMLLFRDWFALLNAGHRMSAVASSDSHDVSRFILGQGRTYVAAKDDDLSKPDLDAVWKSYRQGRLLVSFGLLTDMTVGQKYRVGDLATGLKEEVAVEITILGPSWTSADHVALYANGVLVKEEKLQPSRRPGEKARLRWTLPKPATDTHLVAIATGPGDTGPWWEIPRPYQPASRTLKPRVLGATNPIWLDGDGDGRFSIQPIE